MIASLIAIALASNQSAWSQTSEKLRTVSETYKKWGLTFETELKGSSSIDTFAPAEFEVSGVMETPDTLKIEIHTRLGQKLATALDLGGVFKIDPDGTASEGSGAVYLNGSGLAGKFKMDRITGMSMEAELKEAFYSIGVTFGEISDGILNLGLNFGPFSVKLNPTKWAKRFREVAPVFKSKIGGMSIRVDADALVAALKKSPAPPERFLQKRLSVSLRESKGEFRKLNNLQAVVVDEAQRDIIFVGTADPSLPKLSRGVLQAVAQSVYGQDMHPYVSLDPQGMDIMGFHKPRIGGIPTELRQSELIQTMLKADYSMKQIYLGNKKIDGVPEIMDFVDANSRGFLATPSRFWINPRPMSYGDVVVSKSEKRRLYEVKSSPLICTEQLGGGFSLSPSGATDPEFARILLKMSETLTQKYAAIERQYPESRFAEARQALQLSSVFSVLRRWEKSAWLDALVTRTLGGPVPKTDIPTEFQGLRSPKMMTSITGVVWGMQGGMTSAVELPTAVAGHASFSSILKSGSVEAVRPVSAAPAFMSEDELTDRMLAEAKVALAAHDYQAASKNSAWVVFRREKDLDGFLVLLNAVANIGTPDDVNLVLSRGLMTHPNSWQLLLVKANLNEQLARANAGGFSQAVETPRGAARKAALKVIALNPRATPAYALVARVDHESDDDESSLKYWNMAIGIDPLDATLVAGRAAVKLSKEDRKGGLEDLNRAINLAPLEKSYYVVRAQINRQMSIPTASVKDFETALKFDPRDWNVWGLLGRARLEAGDGAGAIAALTNALNLSPKDTFQELYIQNGEIFVPKPFRIPVDPYANFVKRFGEAPGNIILSIRLLDPELWFLRGKAHFQAEHWKEAQTDLLWYVAAYPEKKAELESMLKTCAEKIGGDSGSTLLNTGVGAFYHHRSVRSEK